jgi:hypothetical protein
MISPKIHYNGYGLEIGTFVDDFGNKLHIKGGRANTSLHHNVILGDGTKLSMNGERLHSVDGPAVIKKNGRKEYYVWGQKKSYIEFLKLKVENVLNAL